MKCCWDCGSRRDVRIYQSRSRDRSWGAPLCGEHRGRMDAWRAVCEEQSCLPASTSSTVTFRGVSIPLLEDSGLARTLELTMAIFGDAETRTLRHMAHLALQHDEDTERERKRSGRKPVAKKVAAAQVGRPETCSSWLSGPTGIIEKCGCQGHAGLPSKMYLSGNMFQISLHTGTLLRADGTWSHECRRAILDLGLAHDPEGFRRAERADPYWATHDDSASVERSSASAGLSFA